MKTLHFGFAACLLVVQLAASLQAQQVQPPRFTRPAAYNDYYRGVQPSPSDRPLPEESRPVAEPVPEYVKDYGKGDNCGCDNGCVGACGCSSDPWRLFPQDNDWGVSVTGWMAMGATANAENVPSQFNGPVTFNDRDEFQANQLYAVLERAVDTGGCGWDYGGRVDVLYGTDYIFTQEVGWETTQTGAPRWNSGKHYGVAMPQAYAEVAYNNVSVKVGRFYTIIGYESVMAPENFFYSHAYAMQYGQPFTHSGALATWEANEQLTVMAGVVNGWNRFDGVEDVFGFLGGFSYTPCHERYSVSFTFIADHEANPAIPAVRDERTMYSLVFKYNVSDDLEYVFQHDAGYHDGGGPVANRDAEWYGINQYLFYTVNDCWKLGARFEWFRDDDGARVTGVRTGNPYAGGSAGDFYEVSLGVNWSPCSNVRVRPELRWDWFNGVGPLPYEDGTDDDQFLAAVDAIILF